MSKHVAIVGNGFDLSLGLKTSYNDFLNSKFFTDINASNHYGLFQFLIHKKGKGHALNNWIDIERLLSVYSNSSMRNGDFNSEFRLLKQGLTNYLYSLDFSLFVRNSHAYKFIVDLAGFDDVVIYNFNYTPTVTLILNELQAKSNIKVNNIHGSLNSEIIFGIEDSIDIKRSDIFLRKSYNSNFNNKNIRDDLYSCRYFYLFGHSLGETDHTYFLEFFENLLDKKDFPFRLYYYGEGGRNDLYNQIYKLVNKELSNFRYSTIIEEINSSIPI